MFNRYTKRTTMHTAVLPETPTIPARIVDPCYKCITGYIVQWGTVVERITKGTYCYVMHLSVLTQTTHEKLHIIYNHIINVVLVYKKNACELFPRFSDHCTVDQAMTSIIVHVYVS